jgi:glycosyltransferase involved in cell wall biosynthesis
MPKAVALIPAYNEASRVGPVILKAREYVSEVWVVDDGSTDNTAQVAREAGAKVLVNEKNQGKGSSVLNGLAAILQTDAELILLLDADGQHDPREIPRFLEAYDQTGATVIVGNRMTDVRTMPWVRKITNYTMSWLLTRAATQPIPDCSCGFRMIHRSVMNQLQLQTRNYEMEQEMLIKVGRAGHRIASVPVTTIYAGSPSHIRPIRDTLRFFQMLWRNRR